VSDLICKQCGQEVQVSSVERVLCFYPVESDGEIDWHSGSESELLESESREARCGCTVCPYGVGLEGRVVVVALSEEDCQAQELIEREGEPPLEYDEAGKVIGYSPQQRREDLLENIRKG